jgi:hypothetical protein
MQVGDLVKVIYDGTMGLVVRVIDGDHPWIYLHTGESFRSEKLEVLNASR